MALRHMTAGDSHGPGLLGILEGMPAGLELSEELLLPQLQAQTFGIMADRQVGKPTELRCDSCCANLTAGDGGRSPQRLDARAQAIGQDA